MDKLLLSLIMLFAILWNLIEYKRSKQHEHWKTFLHHSMEQVTSIHIRYTQNVFGQWRWILTFSDSSHLTLWEYEFKKKSQLNRALTWWESEGLPLQQLTINETNEKTT